MAREIFISLTHQDTGIAEAMRDMLRALFGDLLKLRFSTSKEVEGGIASGEDWFQWIVDRVKGCDFALILITPSSVNKPWILWEAGAVAGAALASNEAGMRKVRPLVYQVSAEMIPSPIRESKVQFRRGDDAVDMRKFIAELVNEYRGELSPDRLINIGSEMPGAIETCLARVRAHLLNAPALATTAVVEEWRLRLEEVMKENRPSEVEHVHDWMDIAFGRNSGTEAQPLDLRIHGRLASLYLKAKKYNRAIQQLELARQLAPRDIFVLRQLGRAHLECGDRDEAKSIIDRILELDPQALSHNAECAALAGRWYRTGGNLAKAGDIYEEALDHNPDSYYLANILAEVRLEDGKPEAAADAFRRALAVIERLDEANVWTHATAANAAFFIGDDERARKHIKAVSSIGADADSLAIVQRGLRGLASKVDAGEQRLAPLLALLRAAD